MAGEIKFRVVKSINDLPPRYIKVLEFGASGLDVNINEKYQAIALDLQISNKDASVATVSINGETGYTIGSGADQTHNNVQVSTLNVSGVTSGFAILQLIPLSELRKVGAVEEA